MGPCWLEVEAPRPAAQPFTWCKFEVEVENPKLVNKMEKPGPPPQLVVMSLRMQTILNHQTHANEVRID